MAHRVRVASCLCLVGTVLILPSPAAAAPPTCLSATVHTAVNTRADLAAAGNPCTDPDGDTYTLTLSSPPAHGTLGPGGSYYDPNPDFHGIDSFSYTATDTHAETSQPATITLVVNSAPVCTDGSVVTTVGHAVVIPDFPCSDVDDPDTFVVIVDDGAHGTVDVADDGTVTYFPSPGFAGTDTFPFWAEDDFGGVAGKRTMTVTVNNPPPAATPVPTPAPLPPAVPASTPPPDKTAPTVTLKNASKKQSVAITLTTSENGSATLTVTLDKATARKLKLGRTVGTLKAAVKPGTSTLKVKLSAKAAKAFKKLKAVKLTVTAVVLDGAGNQTTKTVQVTIRR
ncbi:Ig-like domain-containing protein [Solirubrobacter soli]|uniref:Ig-like domain-containing protein n=1 Tax=Solirubrobacter soli TaxID=363832 RepID=UPI0003F9F735|nr:Ig-like domain-containing protein [Solirubrobacter soli]